MRRRLVVLALVVAACGVKTAPLPPELVQPEPPRDLVAKSTAEGVRLTWHRPTRYSGGKHMRDLGGFEVDRAEGTAAFARVATVEVTDRDRFRQQKTIEWTDTTAVAGATYRYRVVAYTLDAYRSAPAGPLTIEYRDGEPARPAPPPDAR